MSARTIELPNIRSQAASVVRSVATSSMHSSEHFVFGTFFFCGKGAEGSVPFQVAVDLFARNARTNLYVSAQLSGCKRDK
jgi:hypothetical protein